MSKMQVLINNPVEFVVTGGQTHQTCYFPKHKDHLLATGRKEGNKNEVNINIQKAPDGRLAK